MLTKSLKMDVSWLITDQNKSDYMNTNKYYTSKLYQVHQYNFSTKQAYLYINR